MKGGSVGFTTKNVVLFQNYKNILMLISMENVGHYNVQDQKKVIVGKKLMKNITFTWHLKTQFAKIMLLKSSLIP